MRGIAFLYFVLFVFVSAPASAQVVINEINYREDGTNAADFVELKNTGVAGVNLDAFTLELVDGNGIPGDDVYHVSDLPNVVLAPGDYFVLCGNALTVPNCDLDDGPDTHFIQDGPGDAVGLRDGGVLVDAVGYDGPTNAPYYETLSANPDPFVADFVGISRSPDGGDTGVNFVDLSVNCVTPGVANVPAYENCPDPLECGDGTFDPNEHCDAGAGNGTTTCGCTLSCFLADAGKACGSAADVDCSNPDTCNGTGACDPNDEAAGFACGTPSDTECTDPDSCDGAGACLANHEMEGTTCGDATNSDCTDADTCDAAGECDPNDEAVGFACGSTTDAECTDPDSCDGAGVCLVNNETEGAACGDATDSDCTDADACDDDGACITNDVTDGTACGDDGIECTADECTGGVCSHPPLATGAPCGNGADDACTGPDGCDGAGACLSNDAPDGTACDEDGLFCSGAEACAGGACTSAGSPCDTATACDEDANVCVQSLCGDGVVDANEDCDDGNEVGDDGCTGCAVDDGWSCGDEEPSECSPICDECDDVNVPSEEGEGGCSSNSARPPSTVGIVLVLAVMLGLGRRRRDRVR